MRIAQISDTHILALSSELPEAATRAEGLRRCVADINRLDVTPDLVIYTGDTVQTGAVADYEHLADLLRPLKPPIYLTPGNRDDRDNFRTFFRDADGQEPFLHHVFDGFPTRLIALDSIIPGRQKGAFCQDRIQWLDDTLAAEPDRATILFIHHPPFNVGTHYVDGYEDAADQAALAKIVAKHRQVQRLMCGHCHRSSQQLWAESEATTMASVACDLRWGVDAAHLQAVPIYQLHDVAANGKVTTHSRIVPN
jgi:3',5'-cyclic AMP phosphodiesterase CpdA